MGLQEALGISPHRLLDTYFLRVQPYSWKKPAGNVLEIIVMGQA
jgi:hypothetical protein